MDGKKTALIAILVISLFCQVVSAFSLTFNDQAYLKNPQIIVSNQYGVIEDNITNSSQVVTLDPAEAVFITYEPSGLFDIGDHFNSNGMGFSLAFLDFLMSWINKNKGSFIAIIILCAIAIYLAARRS